MLWLLIALVCIEISTPINAQSKRTASLDQDANNTEPDHPIPLESIQGVAGQSATLPCNIQARDVQDAVTMVLWFKESGEPVYSFDARNSHSGKPKFWSAAHFWADRASFRATPPAQLTIRDLRESDEGLYRCRVDFLNSPTRNVKVNFTVIVPPGKPIIYDAKRRDMSKLLEAYPEGADLFLVCEVHGGKPRPRVAWFLESRIIDALSEVRESQSPTGERNTLTISNVTLKSLSRSHYHAKLSCKATNTHLAPPRITAIIIELHMKPLKVEILGKLEILSAGTKYEVRCESTGSKPAAVLTWWKASKQLASSTKHKDGMSISILEWVPSVEDEGKFLVCRASNPKLPEASIEERWKLTVHFTPIVTLKMATSSNPRNVKEGDDVYFECNVKANPRAEKLSWFHEEQELRHNSTAGIVLSNHSLVLQSVTRKSAGRYTCMAYNAEGRASSNHVNLDVLFTPVCKRRATSHSSGNGGSAGWRDIDGDPVAASVPEEIHGALKDESINLACEVEASPATVTFHWTFNNSGDLNDIPSTKYTSEGSFSRLNYTPATEKDYGTLACWASNLVGRSKQPCLYQVIVAGRPYPLQNCTTHNQSGTWIRISCVEGYDGGLPQKFVAIIADQQRLESRNPHWEFELHEPTTISLYAINSKGSSDPVVMEGVTLKGSAKYTDKSALSVDISPILIGLGGTVTGLGLIVTGVLMALWRKHATTPAKQKPKSKTSAKGKTKAKPNPPEHSSISSFTEKPDEEDGNPDLIPTTALEHHLTDRKLLLCGGSLPRRPRQLEGREMSHDIVEDFNNRRPPSSTFYSLQRPHRLPEAITIRAAATQESCI